MNTEPNRTTSHPIHEEPAFPGGSYFVEESIPASETSYDPKHAISESSGASTHSVGGTLRTWSFRALWIFLPALIVGSTAYFGFVLPAEREYLSDRMVWAAERIEDAIGDRGRFVSALVTGIDIRHIDEDGRLERMVSEFHSAFPDFLSMEIANGRGETFAMAGELSTASHDFGQTLPVKLFREPDSVAGRTGRLLIDDPAGGTFSIVIEQPGTEGHSWFIRTRFARTAIDDIVQAAAIRMNGDVRLIPGVAEPTGPKKAAVAQWNVAAHSGNPHPGVTVSESAWSGPTAAEIRLTESGWILTFHRTPHRLEPSTCLVAVPAAGLILALALFVISLPASFLTGKKQPSASESADEYSMPAAADAPEPQSALDSPALDEEPDFTSEAIEEESAEAFTADLAEITACEAVESADETIERLDDDEFFTVELEAEAPEFDFDAAFDAAASDADDPSNIPYAVAADRDPIGDDFLGPDVIEVEWAEPENVEDRMDAAGIEPEEKKPSPGGFAGA